MNTVLIQCDGDGQDVRWFTVVDADMKRRVRHRVNANGIDEDIRSLCGALDLLSQVEEGANLNGHDRNAVELAIRSLTGQLPSLRDALCLNADSVEMCLWFTSESLLSVPWEIVEIDCWQCNTCSKIYRTPGVCFSDGCVLSPRKAPFGCVCPIGTWADFGKRSEFGEHKQFLQGSRFLMVIDPREDLGQHEHAEHLYDLLKAQSYDVQYLLGAQATAARVRSALGGNDLAGAYFFCHGAMKEGYASLLLGGNTTLADFEIEREVKGNPFVFLNSCTTALQAPHKRDSLRWISGLAWAFMASGAKGCVGALRSLEVKTAANAARLFFGMAFGDQTEDITGSLVRPVSVGEALHQMRVLSRMRYENGSANTAWAAYRLFGRPDQWIFRSKREGIKTISTYVEEGFQTRVFVPNEDFPPAIGPQNLNLVDLIRTLQNNKELTGPYEIIPHSDLGASSLSGTSYVVNVLVVTRGDQAQNLRISIEPRVGQTFAGYVLIRQVGEGAHSMVFEAYEVNSLLHRSPVVVKLPKELLIVDRANENILSQAKLWHKISSNHENIVKLFDIKRDNRTGLLLLVLEFVPGITLLHRVFDDNTPIPDELMLKIMRDVCSALVVTHRAGIVHADLKPSNILLTLDTPPVAKLNDFELARPFTQTTSPSLRFAGSCPYLAPEAYHGDHSPASDIYSFGVTFLEATTRRSALPENADVEHFKARMRNGEHNNKIDDLLALTSAPFKAILSQCVKDHSSYRYRSAEELLKEIMDITNQGLNRIKISGGKRG